MFFATQASFLNRSKIKTIRKKYAFFPAVTNIAIDATLALKVFFSKCASQNVLYIVMIVYIYLLLHCTCVLVLVVFCGLFVWSSWVETSRPVDSLKVGWY